MDKWDIELKRILKEKRKDICLRCGREIDRGDIAWNSGQTEYGTQHCSVEIQCLACDTEIAYIESWYPVIEDMEDLCYVLEEELKNE